MSRPDFSPKAVTDLDGILDYIARDRPAAAQRLVESLIERCEMLAKFPEAGTRCESIAPSLRYFSAEPYVIYYRPAGSTVRIERILHGARDAPAIFDGPSP